MYHSFVTGTNRGIGLELVRNLLKRDDMIVFATCRNPDQAHDLQQLMAENPGRIHIIQLDVTNADGIKRAVGQVRQHTDKLDILINNAGIFPDDDRASHLGNLNENSLLRVLRTNSIAPVMVTQALQPLLQGTKIAMISSIMGSMDYGSNGYAAGYRASKAALNMLTIGIAHELREAGCITITMHPGWVKTDMGTDAAPVLPSDSAQGILNVLDNLDPSQNGSYISWEGEAIRW